MLLVPGAKRLADEGPLINVLVGASTTAKAIALVDTGSAMTSVSRALLVRIGAPQIGADPIAAVGCSSVAGVFLVTLQSADGAIQESSLRVLGDGLYPPVEVLVGRDCLAGLKFGYDGPNGAWLLERPRCPCAQGGGLALSVGLLGMSLGAGVGMLIGTARTRR
jgi:hypothetical protein